MDLQALAAPFPRDAVHWRAQTLTRDKTKALALAYLDARDVMDRLDEVCGPANWQSEVVETAKGRVLCRLGIRTSDGWVWKTDGSGDTDVEGEKGAISGAIKRAAVLWGIGRYLYDMPNVWVPCEVDDKGKWRRWTDDPWKYVRNDAPPERATKKPEEQPFDAEDARDRIKDAIEAAETIQRLKEVWDKSADTLAKIKAAKPGMFAELDTAKNRQKTEITNAPQGEAA